MLISARPYTPRQVATNLLMAAGWAFGFYLTLLLIHVLQNLEDPGRRNDRPVGPVPRQLREMRRLLRLNW